MRTFLSILILSVFLSVDIAAQNPTRKVLCTLAPNEVIMYDEHLIQCKLDGYRFAFVVTDTLTYKCAFVFNGKRIPLPWSRVDELSMADFIGYIDPTLPDGYVIKELDRDGYYVNRGGKREGPYERVWWSKDWDWRTKWDHPVSYHYVLANKVFENTGGRIRTSTVTKVLDYGVVAVNGTVRKLNDQAWPDVKGRNYIYRTKDGHWYLNGKFITGKEIHGLYVNDRGDYAYTVYGEHANISQGKNDSKPYVVKNGVRVTDGKEFARCYCLTESGELVYQTANKLYLPGVPEDIELQLKTQINDFIYHNSSHYAFTYGTPFPSHVKISGMADRGPYGYVWSLKYLDNGRYAYVYSDKKYGDDRKEFVCIDGLELGPYSYIDGVRINKSGKYLFAYRPADSKSEYDYTCIRTHDGDYGPFDWITNDIKFSENGDYSFHFCKNGVEYLNENGVVTTLPSSTGRYDGISIDVNGHSFHSEYGFDYVVVDGQRFGKASALKCFYDEPKRVFRWYSIENQELVAYEYALD